MKTHEYTLKPRPFDLIKNGKKTIEMRLYDEKRKTLAPGDVIIFTNTESKDTLTTLVVSLHPFPSFKELYASFLPRELGYEDDETPDYTDMEYYYSRELINKYGALAIKIRLLAT